MSYQIRTLEVCVDSVQSAVNAECAGANRLELCQDLDLGGTTPSYGLIKTVMKHSKLPIVAMIRPRAGDFCYDSHEFETMLEDICMIKSLGIPEIITGILTPDGKLDINRMAHVIRVAKPMKVVLHRTFDMCDNLFEALEDAKRLGIVRILSAGGRQRAIEGRQSLKMLLKKSKDIVIMPGSGIDMLSAKVFKEDGFSQVHLSGKVNVASKMIFQKEGITMGASKEDDYTLSMSSVDKIKAVVDVFM